MVTQAEKKRHNVQKVIKSFTVMILYGVFITALAKVVAHFVNEFYPLTKFGITLVEYTAYICWSATLGMLGWEIHTNGGNSPAEMLNQKLAKFFSLLGIFLFIISKEFIARS